MAIKESGEMYLETILILSKKKEEVHAIDIVKKMNFSKPSVSIAMSKLKDEGLIDVDNLDHITLTSKGLEIAQKIYERHTVLTNLLLSLGVDEDNAVNDACKFEHDISDATFEALKKHYESFKK